MSTRRQYKSRTLVEDLKKRRRENALLRQKINRNRKIAKRRREEMISKLANNFVRLDIKGDVFNVGTITRSNQFFMEIRLSKKLVRDLLKIYRKTWDEQVEYAGQITFNLSNTRNSILFNTPTFHTNKKLAGVVFQMNDLNQYITYHTHPVPKDVGPLFTYPSTTDLSLYIRTYPHVQANMILEKNGYYIVDLIETNMNKPRISEVQNEFSKLISDEKFSRASVTWSNLAYFKTTPERWQKAVNNNIDPIMRKKFGISIRYHFWNELGTITLLNKNSLMMSNINSNLSRNI
jgi:hypothetical protein